MEALEGLQKKQLFYTRIMCAALVVVALAAVYACAVLIPKATATLNSLDALLESTSVMVEEAKATLDGINVMSADISKAADGINTLVEENSETLSDSMSKLNAIDFEGLNQAISDLQAVVEPMANFMNRFR